MTYSPLHGFAMNGWLSFLLSFVTEVVFLLATLPLIVRWISEHEEIRRWFDEHREDT